jgi:hypothetical protein
LQLLIDHKNTSLTLTLAPNPQRAAPGIEIAWPQCNEFGDAKPH